MSYCIVLDTETAPTAQARGCDPANMRVYDLGWVVMDKNDGSVVNTFNCLVRETWCNDSMMTSAYYANKLPMYRELVNRGTLPTLELNTAKGAFEESCRRWGVKDVWAWNVRFDYTSLNATVTDYSNGFVRRFFPDSVKLYDVMSVAAQTVCDTKKYRAWCSATGNVTPKGKPRTTAEAVHRYLTKDEAFVESHTALHDATIEAASLWACLKRRGACKKLGSVWGVRCK